MVADRTSLSEVLEVRKEHIAYWRYPKNVSTEIKMMWYWQRDRHLDHWDRVDSHRELNMTEVTYLAGRQTGWKRDP